MANNKHIDRIFQEKFKDFEQQPSAQNWQAIKQRLNQKRRRPFVFWWRVAGVAAVLAVITALIISNQNDTPANYTSEDYINFEYIKDKERKLTSSKEVQNALAVDIDALSQQRLKKSSVSVSQKESIANKDANQNNKAKADYKKVFQSTEEFVDKFNQSEKKNSNKGFQGTFSLADTEITDLIPDDYTNPPEVNLTGFLNAGLKKKTDSTKTNDSKNDTQIAKNEDSPANDLAEKEKQDKTSKWLINPEVSPVLAGSFSGKNALGADFSSNETTTNTSLTYGINVGYQLSSKWRITSGIKQLNTRSTVKNVLTARAGFSQSIASSNLSQNKANMIVTTPSTFKTLSTNGRLGRIPTQNATLKRQLDFVELPVGLAYKILNRQIGIEVSAGASSLFVNNNEVFVTSKSGTEKIGRLENVNSTSFITNLGLGFDYNISKSFDINLRPTLKYQLNTFDSSTTDYQPYIIAVYTGFSYRF